jgi:error-prone DNA polymerase
MAADYRTTSMSVDVHPLELLRPHLPDGVLTSLELFESVHGAQVAFAGFVIARQRPSTANGVLFMLLEDEHGQVNLIVPEAVYERNRAVVRGETLLLARGRFERHDRNRNILVSEVESLAPLARRASGEDLAGALPAGHRFGRR